MLTTLKLPQNSNLYDKSMFSSVNLSFDAVKMRQNLPITGGFLCGFSGSKKYASPLITFL
jgi:hypothetical protein